jgi:hypothetical protein
MLCDTADVAGGGAGSAKRALEDGEDAPSSRQRVGGSEDADMEGTGALVAAPAPRVFSDMDKLMKEYYGV